VPWDTACFISDVFNDELMGGPAKGILMELLIHNQKTHGAWKSGVIREF
jgi:hypothetical protein